MRFGTSTSLNSVPKSFKTLAMMQSSIKTFSGNASNFKTFERKQSILSNKYRTFDHNRSTFKSFANPKSFQSIATTSNQPFKQNMIRPHGTFMPNTIARFNPPKRDEFKI